MQYNVIQQDYIRGGVQKNFYAENEVEACACPLCNGTDFKCLAKERGSLGVVICNSCSLIYTNPRAIGAEENYFGNAQTYYQEARLIFNGKKKHHRDRNYEYELREIKKIKSSGSLLDIGTNMGFFLRKAREFGFETEGVEPSPALSKIAREQFNLKIRNSFFEGSDFTPGSFDIITMIDVFEHVTTPHKVLQSARMVLKDDGIICIKVPNGNYNLLKMKLAQMTGKQAQFDVFDSCEHVAHYTSHTMRAMLKANQLQIVKLILPVPVHPPVWSGLVGHYYQYPSPFILDWKRIIMRNAFYFTGKLQQLAGLQISFAPDLMFIIKKQNSW